MTQAKSLEDLPSQLDFDWQESETPVTSVAPAIVQNLGEELDVASTPAIGASHNSLEVDKFAKVSQIAQEAIMDALQQETPVPIRTTTTATTDVHLV